MDETKQDIKLQIQLLEKDAHRLTSIIGHLDSRIVQETYKLSRVRKNITAYKKQLSPTDTEKNHEMG